MATLTGANLLDSILQSTGVTLNALVTATLTAKLQQMIDNGTYSDLASSIASSGFSTDINTATEVPDLSDAITINRGLIEAAADQDAVDDIVYPPYTDDTPPTFTLTTDVADAGILEGLPGTYTVTASKAVAEDTVITFSVIPGNGDADQSTNGQTNANDFVQGTLTPMPVTILAGETVGSVTVTGKNDGLTEIPEDFSVTATVTSGDGAGTDITSAPLTVTLLDGAGTFVLTPGIDKPAATLFNDTFEGNLSTVDGAGGTVTSTFSALDDIDGLDGEDTFNLNFLDTVANAPVPASAKVANVEIVNVQSVADVTLNTSTWTGLETLNLTGALGDANLTASDTTAISVAGVHDGTAENTVDIFTDGGSTVTVNAAIQMAQTIQVLGATGDVTVTASENGGTTTGDTGGIIAVGNVLAANAPDAVAGAVAISSTGTAAKDNVNLTLGNVFVDGGTTVSVTQTGTSSSAGLATLGTTGATHTMGDVTTVGGNTTTSVTSTQSNSAAEVLAKTAVTGATTVDTILFTALDAADVLTIGGLTLTVGASAMTATEVATAFAGLTTADTHGPATKGVYTGSFTAAFTGATVSGDSSDTVVYTSTAPDTVAAQITKGGADAAKATITATSTGVLAVTAVEGVLGVINGTVDIDDNATASITTLTVDGYGDTTVLGSGGSLDALTTLSLSNSGGTAAGDKDAAVVLTSTAVALDLNVDNIQGAVSLDGTGATVATLNLAASGTASVMPVTGIAMTTLNVSGSTTVNLTGGNLAALTTVAVTETAGITLDAAAGNLLTSVDTTGTTGTNTISIDGTVGTYTGGAGVDNVTTLADAGDKAIDLGGGDDTLNLFETTATVAADGSIKGGAGDADTLVILADDADGAEAGFATKITEFERVTITKADAGDDSAVDVTALGNYDYVSVLGSLGALSIEKLVSGGTVNLLGASAGDEVTTVEVTDSAVAENTSDVLNVITTSIVDGNADFGEVVAANVETINITTANFVVTPATAVDVHTLDVTAVDATSIVIDGDADLVLDNSANVLATTINASAMTGALTVTLANNAANATVTGGSGNDTLTASTLAAVTPGGDILNGGDGNDIFQATAEISTMTGGAGNDTFNIDFSTGIATYAHVADFTVGDHLIMLTVDNAVTQGFVSAQTTLNDTADFAAWVDEALDTALNGTGGGAGSAAWFQYAGNTYVVMDDATEATATYVAGSDSLVRLTGLIDLSTAAFNGTDGSIHLF